MNQVDNNQAATQEVENDQSISSPVVGNQGATHEEDQNTSIPHLVDDKEGVDDNEPLEAPEFFEGVEHHWDETEGPDLEGLVKELKDTKQSYSEARKLISQGKHKAPENGEYSQEVITEELGIDEDDPMLEPYNEWANKHGISQAAYDDLARRMIGQAMSNQVDTAQTVADMKAELGEDADNILKSNIQWADGLVRKGILTEDEREELDVMGGTPAAQRILVKFRGMQGDMAPIPTVSAPEGMESEEEFRAKMKVAMDDPRYGVEANYTKDVEKNFIRRYNR